MSVVAAFADGCRRVLHAPVLIIGIWLVSCFVPSPVRIGSGDALLAAIDATTLESSIALLTFGWDQREWLLHAGLATFLLGGLMDRLARDRATASFGFFGACGTFFFRFLRLSALAGPVYALLLLVLPPRLDAGPGRAIVTIALVAAFQVVLDYARVRMVVEDRRSALGAFLASLRFVRRNPGAIVTLALVNSALAGGTWWLATNFAIADTLAVYAYFLARTLLRLIAMASPIALFQSRLAHAGYTARPLAIWPDSSAADAVLPR